MYCGKRSKLSFKEMIRPVKSAASFEYECPENTKPCNEDFFDGYDGHDYVVCIPKFGSIEDYCPITSIAFDLE